MPRWWRKRNEAERFDLYSRLTVYLNYAAVPPLIAISVASEIGVLAAWLIGAGATVLAVSCVLLIRASIAIYVSGSRAVPRKHVAVATALTVAAVVAGYAVYPGPSAGHPDGPGDGIVVFGVTMYFAAMATALRPRWSAALWVVITAATALVMPNMVMPFAAMTAIIGGGYRATLWMLGLFWELDRARQLEGLLAVGEERMRFARDMHDVVGRNLSVLALKAELAAQLAKRGKPEAVDEMLEVRQIAQDSLAEVRAVVSGMRTADLVAEMAGARSLLTSAGIDCRVIGATGGLPERVQSALGWAVREGTTNVLRHSEASTCSITLRREPGRITLTMENNGAKESSTEGTGLIGLAERIGQLGGSVAGGREGHDRYRLTVTLPLEEEQ